MSPSLRSRPGGHIRLLVLGLLLAVAALLVAPAAIAAPSSAGAPGADPAATADRLTRALGAKGAGAYLDASGRLTVNVLGGEAAAQVRAAGRLPGWRCCGSPAAGSPRRPGPARPPGRRGR